MSDRNKSGIFLAIDVGGKQILLFFYMNKAIKLLLMTFFNRQRSVPYSVTNRKTFYGSTREKQRELELCHVQRIRISPQTGNFHEKPSFRTPGFLWERRQKDYKRQIGMKTRKKQCLLDQMQLRHTNSQKLWEHAWGLQSSIPDEVPEQGGGVHRNHRS